MLASHNKALNIIVCLLMLLPASAEARSRIQSTEPPSAAPEINYLDDKNTFNKLDYTGAKLTVLHFWATWCAPCIEELPQVDLVARLYESKKVKFVAISTDNDMNKVKRFYQSNRISKLRPLIDYDNQNFRALQLKGLPSTIFINNKGQEIGRVNGPLTWNDAYTLKFIDEQIKPKEGEKKEGDKEAPKDAAPQATPPAAAPKY